MKSLADALPPEIAQQIHPDWRKNEAAYWSMRDQLLSQYQDQWIGFADGAVIAAAPTPLEVFLAVQQSGRHPFVIRVGHEDEPWYRIRGAGFAYGEVIVNPRNSEQAENGTGHEQNRQRGAGIALSWPARRSESVEGFRLGSHEPLARTGIHH